MGPHLMTTTYILYFSDFAINLCCKFCSSVAAIAVNVEPFIVIVFGTL